MSRTSKLLLAAMIGFMLALGVPAAAVTVWQDMVIQYSLVAILLVLAYEGALAAVAGVAAGPVQQRLTQLSTAADHALGRRLSRYARQYREYVRTWQRFVDWRGLATTGAYTPELDRVFVDVGLAPRPPHQVPAGVLAEVPPDVSQRYSIHEFLDRPEPAVLAVIGAPGSGKTTLLRHVAQQTVHPHTGRRRRMPVLLPLRDHCTRIADAPDTPLPQVLRASLPEMPVSEPAGWWEQQLHHGRCVVLLDGLDEVARAEERRTVADWIEAQIVAYPRNDFVVTSRPHGYRTAVVAGAEVLQVLPFTDTQVRRFLHGWYLATERHATGADGPDVKVRAEERADDLLDRLASAPGLYDLAVNPLLLTMIALVHRYRSALPAGRADLYREIAQVMLWRRQEAKRLASELPGVGRERVLAHLAYTMMNRRVRDLPRAEVLATIAPTLRRISTDLAAEECLAELESSGLLVEREHDLYAFAHHTLGEYLAAKHIRDHGLVEELTGSVGDAWWRETTLLYVAEAEADAVVQACLAAGTITALALAFDCVHHGGALAPELRDRLATIHEEAFQEDADPERRRLVASVLAARRLCRLAPVGAGGRVCPHPVTSDLYWLFCQDTGRPFPDGVPELSPDPAEPVCGLWFRDALAFVFWLNTSIAAPGGWNIRYRLPTRQEVQQLATQTTEPARAGCVWTRQEDGDHTPQLWLASAAADPRTVTVEDLRRATVQDAVRSPILLELLLVSASALDRAIDLDPAAYGPPVPDRERDQSFPFAIARDLDLSHTLTHFQDFQLGREHAFDLANALGFAGTFDIARAQELTVLNQVGYREVEYDHAPTADHLPAQAQFPGPGVARALASALGLEFSQTSENARVRDLATGLRHELALTGRVRPDRRIDLIRRVVMGSALAASLGAVHDRREPKHRRSRMQPLAETFAETLVARSGIDGNYHVTVSLDTLPEVLHRACGSLTGGTEPESSWAATVCRQLDAVGGEVLARRRPLSDLEPVVIRVPALALAAEADRRDRPADAAAFRLVAAGVTLLQRRYADRSSLEQLVLARA